jgi:hypothetical protein
VVLEELGHEAGREAPHLRRVRRPDGARLRHDQALDEVAGEALLLEPVPERRRGPVHPDQRPRLTVEATPVAQHPEEGGADEVGGAGEEAPRRPAVLEAAATVGDGEAHVRGLARHPELRQQRFELGVVTVVEDDEPGVDPVGPVLGLDRHRVGVAADPLARLVDDDLVLGVQPVRGHQSRDPGADDRDLHRPFPTREAADRLHWKVKPVVVYP